MSQNSVYQQIHGVELFYNDRWQISIQGTVNNTLQDVLYVDIISHHTASKYHYALKVAKSLAKQLGVSLVVHYKNPQFRYIKAYYWWDENGKEYYKKTSNK